MNCDFNLPFSFWLDSPLIATQLQLHSCSKTYTLGVRPLYFFPFLFRVLLFPFLVTFFFLSFFDCILFCSIVLYRSVNNSGLEVVGRKEGNVKGR